MKKLQVYLMFLQASDISRKSSDIFSLHLNEQKITILYFQFLLSCSKRKEKRVIGPEMLLKYFM